MYYGDAVSHCEFGRAAWANLVVRTTGFKQAESVDARDRNGFRQSQVKVSNMLKAKQKTTYANINTAPLSAENKSLLDSAAKAYGFIEAAENTTLNIIVPLVFLAKSYGVVANTRTPTKENPTTAKVFRDKIISKFGCSDLTKTELQDKIKVLKIELASAQAKLDSMQGEKISKAENVSTPKIRQRQKRAA